MRHPDGARTFAKAHQLGVEGMISDAALALIFLDIADAKITTSEDRSRLLGEALAAYQSILRLRPRSSPAAGQNRILDERLNTLRARLSAAEAVRFMPDSKH